MEVMQVKVTRSGIFGAICHSNEGELHDCQLLEGESLSKPAQQNPERGLGTCCNYCRKFRRQVERALTVKKATPEDIAKYKDWKN